MTSKAPVQSEKQFMANVVEIAGILGWAVYHPWLSIRSERGWPDLALVRERLILAELKSEKGKLTPAQETWLGRLREAGVETYEWRPSDWDGLVAVLQRRHPALAGGFEWLHDAGHGPLDEVGT